MRSLWLRIFIPVIITMKYAYRTFGTCSEMIEFEIIDNHLHNVRFYGGCSGNLQGLSKLLVGMSAQEAIDKLEGIRCGRKPTSCPDQLAQALKIMREGEQ